MFEPQSSTKQRRIHIVVAVIVVIVAFTLGILIGYFAIKKPKESKEQDVKHEEQDKKAELQQRNEEMLTYHKKFQATVSEQELEKSLG